MLATLATLTLAACAADRSAPADTLRAIWDQGTSFQTFLAGARARVQTWKDNYGYGVLEPDVRRRVDALPGSWRVLVVLEDRCSDSVQTIPYLATLADSAAGRIELRIVNSTVGRPIMDSHRTRDDRGATPTVLLLDEDLKEIGCWVERPAPLAEWAYAERDKYGEDEFVRRKTEWYRKDRGRTTLRELLTMMETAGPGRPCGGGA